MGSVQQFSLEPGPVHEFVKVVDKSANPSQAEIAGDNPCRRGLNQRSLIPNISHQNCSPGSC
jgi:hypothetical protein